MKLLWHTPSNCLAIAEFAKGGLPLLTVLDDEFTGINPFFAYPLEYLKYWGWIEIGEL